MLRYSGQGLAMPIQQRLARGYYGQGWKRLLMMTEMMHKEEWWGFPPILAMRRMLHKEDKEECWGLPPTLAMRCIQRWKRKGPVLILLQVDYPDETLRGRCRVSISHVSKIHSLCNEKNGEPENLPSTHGDLSKNSGQILSYPYMSLSIMLISEAAGTGLDRSIKPVE